MARRRFAWWALLAAACGQEPPSWQAAPGFRGVDLALEVSAGPPPTPDAPLEVQRLLLGSRTRRLAPGEALVVAFDRQVDAAEVVPRLQVIGPGGPIGLALADPADGPGILEGIRPPGTTVAVRPVAPLEPDTQYKLALAGSPPDSKVHSFRSAEGFGIVCDRGRGLTAGETGFSFYTTTPAPALTAADLVVVPPFDGLGVVVRDTFVYAAGPLDPGVQRHVSLGATARDATGRAAEIQAPCPLWVEAPSPALQLPFERSPPTLPRSRPVLPIVAQGVGAVRVRVWAVPPGADAGSPAWRGELALAVQREPPLRDDVVAVSGAREPLELSLGDQLPAGVGRLFVRVDPVDDVEVAPVESLVQVTDLGLSAVASGGELHLWVTSLTDGRPLEGVEVGRAGAPLAVTDARGVARMPLPVDGAVTLVARSGEDVAVVRRWESEASWTVGGSPRPVRWRVAVDPRPQRPGATLALAGWATGDGSPDAASAPIRWSLHHGLASVSGEVPRRTDGWFKLDIELPEDLGPWDADVVLEAGVDPPWRRIVTVAGPEPQADPWRRHVLLGEQMGWELVDAAAAGAPVRWDLVLHPVAVEPPGHPGWTFGLDPAGADALPLFEERTAESALDAAGRSALTARVERLSAPIAVEVTARSRIGGVGGAPTAADAEARPRVVVHPAAVAVGLRSARQWAAAGTAFDVEVIAVDPNGSPVPGLQGTVALQRRGEEPVASCAFLTGSEPVRCGLLAPSGGWWVAAASTADAAGRPAVTELDLYAAGGDAAAPLRGAGRVSVLPDRRAYRAGEVADVLVSAPFAAASGIVTRHGAAPVPFAAGGRSEVLVPVPVGDAAAQAAELTVEVVGVDGAYGRGTAQLVVDPPRLEVALVWRRGELVLTVHDADGAPLPADAVVLVSDARAAPLRASEGWDAFYDETAGLRRRPVAVHEALPQVAVPPERDLETIARLIDTPCGGSAPPRFPTVTGPAWDGAPSALAPPPQRVRTGSDGRAVVPLALGDGSYRVVVVAGDGRVEGRAELLVDR